MNATMLEARPCAMSILRGGRASAGRRRSSRRTDVVIGHIVRDQLDG